MVETTGLNNRVYQMLSQKSSKVAVDILGMRLSTNYKNKFTEIMITETEAFGRQKTDPMSLVNMFNRKFPESLPKGPPHILVLKSYGENRSLYLLTSKGVSFIKDDVFTFIIGTFCFCKFANLFVI